MTAPAGLAAHGASALQPLSFDAIEGWAEDDLGAAFRTFRAGARRLVEHLPKTRSLGVSGADLQRLGVCALSLGETLDRGAARQFFETHFRPCRIAERGFVTGYYEPELAASRSRSAAFPIPLLRRPADLAEVAAEAMPEGWDPSFRFARRGPKGLERYFDRPAIEDGALDGQGLELAWLADPVDAFFVHVQGSARLRFADGGRIRVAFAGKSGHPYTSIGRLAVERGLLRLDEAHSEGLKAWLKAEPDRGRALMRENRSFIFFRQVDLAETEGPMGAAGVPLTAGRSLAVDRGEMTFHTPVWVAAPGLEDPARGAAPFRRLMIAQDTGSAIVGRARGDLFFGSGDAAGALAGRVRHAATMVVLVPVPQRAVA